jgi:hypothetical protein
MKSPHEQREPGTPMAISFDDLTNKQLQTLIENHQRKNATDTPKYTAALQELERRTGKGLDFEKSRSIIIRAAKRKEFLTYKELADASGAEWNKVHYAINGHLWRLINYAKNNDWPMLSAVVVNQKHKLTGNMEPKTLKGFINAARLLGHSITDEDQFLRDQQQQVFTWASNIEVK